MKRATLVLVRPDPTNPQLNHRDDVALARRHLAEPPCWVIQLGEHREVRLDRLKSALGQASISARGVSVWAPTQLSVSSDPSMLAGPLAIYLCDMGLWVPLKQADRVVACLPADLDPALLVAVVEAASVHPRVDILLGEQEIPTSLRWELRRTKFRAPPPSPSGSDLTGRSPELDRVRQQIERYAGHPFPVLVMGETGTGKEVVARMLHEESACKGRFIAQNAAQLTPELADSLLFGHRKGSFTGADTDRPGRIKETEGGTFFLDEVFNLHPSVQAKLLRALNHIDEGMILVEPVGSHAAPDHVRTRLVVSALADPRTESGAAGTSSMRHDLFYRVAAGVIRLPPLRDCLDDLPDLCTRRLEKLNADLRLEDSAIDALRAHSWPGNVRELQLVLLRAIMDSPPKAKTLTADAVRRALHSTALPGQGSSIALPGNLALELARMEVATMHAAISRAQANASEAGRLIGLGKNAKNFGRNLEQAESKLRRLEQNHAS